MIETDKNAEYVKAPLEHFIHPFLPVKLKIFPNLVHTLLISLQPGLRAVKLNEVRHSITCLRCLFHLYAKEILATHAYPKEVFALRGQTKDILQKLPNILFIQVSMTVYIHVHTYTQKTVIHAC